MTQSRLLFIVAGVLVLALAVAAWVVWGKDSESGPVTAGVTVHAIDDLPDDFMMGVDVSSVLSLEESGVQFYGHDGEPADLFEVLAESGVNYVRVRVWNDPYDNQGRGFGGGTTDVDRATEIGRRATDAGMQVLVNFHYSDFWADPGKQMAPKAWVGMSDSDKAQATYEFTLAALSTMRDAGVDVGMVQVGNETNNAVAGVSAWNGMAAIFNAGSVASREVYPDALVAVHFTNPERDGEYRRFAMILDNFDVDYDVFASSYYPFWHGSLDNLTAVLSEVATDFGKDVAVVETSWVYTFEDGDGHDNVISQEIDTQAYPVSPQGQANAIRDITQAVVDVGPAGLGVFYWEPAWLPVGPPESLTANAELWEAHGSGWASRAAGSYDPGDAGVYYGGSAWENQALFDVDGHPLDSLRVFQYLRTGAVAPLAVARIQSLELSFQLGTSVELPATVDVEYNDRTIQAIPVTWQSPLPTAAALGEFAVDGTLEDGAAVRAAVTIRPRNDVVNHGFEDEDDSMWVFDSPAQTFRVVDDNPAAAMGARVVNFWHDAVYGLSLTQTVTGLDPGTYRLSVSVHGNGEGLQLIARTSQESWAEPLLLEGWQAWHRGTIGEVQVGADGILVIGVEGSLKAGNWGFIDDFELTPADL